ncbi:DUF2383 domain-containing protein [Polyangium aurulentum]|uniref:DUF2383 domain-containing protein n=1 Tax=Polyangium aurulentum TaxID=2567896 RepID=UPI00146A60AA|nr:DUF2383 domain-containing protein [Polyangium aurulentum]UQA61942.1 PA2169 family four-helix-bundle protein [Polyangium aurulentum]
MKQDKREPGHVEIADEPMTLPANEVGVPSVRSAHIEEVPVTARSGAPRNTSTIESLNELLRGELASVETYELALRTARDVDLASALRQIRDSHGRRVAILQDKIRELGGQPVASSGAWGAFTRLVQRGADLLGNRTALAALEEGEDVGKRRYARELDELDETTRHFVLTELAPEQQKTHDLSRSLLKYVKAA